MMKSTKPLPPKEKALFNRILKCYEQKQYKNGLKFAKQILSNPKFTEHGETLAMKGLTLNCMNRKEEAYDLVKRGLKNDLTSHVCWHVYGLLQRSDKKYDEAIKCYRNALRWDRENLHILRDLSMLQVHMRDLEGYKETRYTLLHLKPGQRASWIGYAIANHLLHEYNTAYQVLEEFRLTQLSQSGEYEYSELVLYQCSLLLEGRKFKAAQEHLSKHRDRITDKLRLLEIEADIHLHLKQWDKAEAMFTDLLYRNPENHKYYYGLEASIKPGNEKEKLQIYDAIATIFPKADSAKLLPLRFMEDLDNFRTRVDNFMQSRLRRGVPPLFKILKCLYSNSQKVAIIEGLVKGYLENMQKCQKLVENDEITEPPSTLLWIYYFLAQHYDKIGSTDVAYDYVKEAIDHTPTLIELHVLKAKILWHSGDEAASVKAIDEAQALDTADRFINYKCACYMIRHNMIKEAEEMASKFTRETISVQEYLREMQCMWFEVECARTYYKNNNFGESLKKCHEIDRHFKEIIEDQFDFHQYCMRKMTLRAYVDMLRLEDSLRSHHFYFEAAKVAITVYINLHDKPQNMNGDQNAENEKSLSQSELKKRRNKQRKQERKKAAEEEKRKQEQEKLNKQRQNRNKEDESDVVKKEEFDAKKLVETSTPLEDAKRFLSPLLMHYAGDLETHLLAYEVYERQGKCLLMLKSLLKAKPLSDEGSDPKYHKCLMRFLMKVDTMKLGEQVSTVVNNMLPAFTDGLSWAEYNANYLSKHISSLPHYFAGLCVSKNSSNTSPDTITENIINCKSGNTLKICKEMKDAIEKGEMGDWSKEHKEKFRIICNKRYPKAIDFMDKSQQMDKGDAKNKIKENGIESCHVNHESEGKKTL